MKKGSSLQSHLRRLVALILLSSPAAEEPNKLKKKHFVLVHGVCHGGWSWYKVSTILESWGYKATALDMASSGIDQIQAKTLTSSYEYFEPLRKFMDGLGSDETVVLVGHSSGGLGVAFAMEDFPLKVSVAVFVAAVMPGPNLSLSAIHKEEEKQGSSALDSYFVYENGLDKPPTALAFGPLKLAKHLYPLSPPEDLTLAKALVRPHGLFRMNETEFKFTTERYGCVKRVFVVTEKDVMATRKFQMWMIQNNQPDIVVEIKGADHMAMASKPLELARRLETIAHQFSLLDF